MFRSSNMPSYIDIPKLFCMLRHHFLLLAIAYGKRLIYDFRNLTLTILWRAWEGIARCTQLLVIIYSLIPLVEYNNSPTN